MSAVGPLRLAAAVLLILSDPALALAQSTRALRPVDAATAESHVGASNGHLYARPVDRWGRDSRLRLEILADLSHGHAQVSPVDPSCPVPHSRLKIED